MVENLHLFFFELFEEIRKQGDPFSAPLFAGHTLFFTPEYRSDRRIVLADIVPELLHRNIVREIPLEPVVMKGDPMRQSSFERRSR